MRYGTEYFKTKQNMTSQTVGHMCTKSQWKQNEIVPVAANALYPKILD